MKWQYRRKFKGSRNNPNRGSDMGKTHSRIMSRLRIKYFSFDPWVDLNRKTGENFEFWVDLNQYLGIHWSHELILSQFLESRLSPELNWFKSPRYCLSHELILIKILEWNAQKSQQNFVNAQQKLTKFSESPKKVNEIEWMRKKGHRNQQLIRIIEPWLDSSQYSRLFLSHKSIWIKIPDFFLSREFIWIKIFWKFLSRELILIKFLGSWNILSRELIWITSCKAIMSHE